MVLAHDDYIFIHLKILRRFSNVFLPVGEIIQRYNLIKRDGAHERIGTSAEGLEQTRNSDDQYK